MMHAYASRPGGERNLSNLRRNGWRLLVSPETAWAKGRGKNAVSFEEQCRSGSIDGFKHVAADNGAWTCFQQNRAFDMERFRRFMTLIGPICDFGIVPDIVLGGMESLNFSITHMDECLDHFKTVLLAVQNGMEVSDLEPFVGPRVGIFVGGDSRWKEETVDQWAALCRERHTWCHVGRVNTVRRISICECAGATSFDGTSVTRYSVNLRKLDNGRRQETLLRYQ